jgi:hypothetical protein
MADGTQNDWLAAGSTVDFTAPPEVLAQGFLQTATFFFATRAVFREEQNQTISISRTAPAFQM